LSLCVGLAQSVYQLGSDAVELVPVGSKHVYVPTLAVAIFATQRCRISAETWPRAI